MISSTTCAVTSSDGGAAAVDGRAAETELVSEEFGREVPVDSGGGAACG